MRLTVPVGLSASVSVRQERGLSMLLGSRPQLPWRRRGHERVSATYLAEAHSDTFAGPNLNLDAFRHQVSAGCVDRGEPRSLASDKERALPIEQDPAHARWHNVPLNLGVFDDSAIAVEHGCCQSLGATDSENK